MEMSYYLWILALSILGYYIWTETNFPIIIWLFYKIVQTTIYRWWVILTKFPLMHFKMMWNRYRLRKLLKKVEKENVQ